MQFFQWMADNWTVVCAWIGGLYTLYKAGSIVTALIVFFTSLTSRFKNAENMLSLLSTNHLPHLQAELEKLNEGQEKANDTLASIREDLRLVLFEKIRDHDE